MSRLGRMVLVVVASMPVLSFFMLRDDLLLHEACSFSHHISLITKTRAYYFAFVSLIIVTLVFSGRVSPLGRLQLSAGAR